MSEKSQTNKSALRQLVRGTYDLQKLRIQTGNRVTGQFKVKVLGQQPGESEEKLDQDARKVLKILRESYERITDGIVNLPTPKKFKGDGVISTYTELVLVDQYFSVLASEQKHFRRMESAVKLFPLWDHFLASVKGCGPAMAGVILSEFDITKARYPSSLWKYAGLDVAEDGRGRSSRKEHQVERQYVNKKGEEAVRMSLTHNRFLKTKLIGVLGPSFIKQQGEYAQVYYDYKNRLENHADHSEDSKIRRHNMAIRYCVKIFLVHLYRAWRPLEGLPVAEPYAQAKLGMPPHGKQAS